MADENIYGELTIKLEIDGVLDLHAFSPKDVKTLIPDYLEECIGLGIFQVTAKERASSGERYTVSLRGTAMSPRISLQNLLMAVGELL